MKVFRQEYKPQLVIVDEGAKDTLFSKKNLDKTKKFFHGKGRVMEQKYMSGEVMLKDTFVLMATN